MTPKHDLFDLIQSLSNTEINAFRKEVGQRAGKKVYLKVFEAILSMEAYDEASLKTQFKGEKTLNNFSIAKSNLYEKILEILSRLPHHQNLETKFDKFRHQISILLKKSLYKQALQRVRKTIRIAEKLESFRMLQDLYELHREIARNYLPPRDYVNLHNEIRAKEAWLREVNNNLQRYKEFYETANIAPYFRREIRKAMIGSILRHHLMQDESECRSISASLYFFRTWNYLYTIQERDSGWQYFSGKIIDILSENMHMLADAGVFLVYVNTLFDYGYKCIFEGEIDIARDATEKLKGIRKSIKTGENEALIFSRYWKLRMMIAKYELNQEAGMVAIKEIRNGLRKFNDKLSRQDEMELEFMVSVFLLTMERPSEAISWILRLREERVTSNRPDLHFYSWLLFLIAHFNLGHFDVVEQQAPGTKNYLKDKKALGPLEKLALEFFKKVIRAKNMSETREVMENFSNELDLVLGNKRYGTLTENFDIKAWIESRLEGIPLNQYLLEESTIPSANAS